MKRRTYCYPQLLACIVFSILCFGLISDVHSQGLKWAAGIVGQGSEVITEAEITDGGEIYATGDFSLLADFDPGPGVFNLNSGGNVNGWVQKLNSDGTLGWAGQIGNSQTANDFVRPFGLTVSDSGYIYIGGYYQNNVDFDPGPGTNFLNAWTPELFVLKLDTSGQFHWVYTTRAVGFNPAFSGWSVDTDPQGNVLVAGLINDSVDVDPGPGTQVLEVLGGGYNTVVIKLDPTGGLIWGRSYGDGGQVQGTALAVDGQGNTYTGGTFSGTADMDPGVGVNTMTSNGGQDIFVHKLDVNGNLQWVKQIGGATQDKVTKLAITSSGEIVASGLYSSVVDFDPGPGVTTLTTQGLIPSYYNGFVLKLDAMGTFVWVRGIDASLTGGLRDIAVGPNDWIYACGEGSDTLDLDPGLGNDLAITQGQDPYFIVLDDNGIYRAGHAMEAPSTASEIAWTIDVNSQEEFVVGGIFSMGMDFNPGPAVDTIAVPGFGTDLFLATYSLDSCAQLVLLVDSITDPTCADPGYLSFQPAGGIPPYTISWASFPTNTDTFATLPTSGFQQVSLTDAQGCVELRNILVNGPLFPSGLDVGVGIFGQVSPPGFTWPLQLNAYNNGCVPANGQLCLVLTPLVNYVSASPAPSQINGDTLLWDLGGMTSDSAALLPVVTLQTDSNAVMGETACFELKTLGLSGDIDTTNNSHYFCQPITNSFDPNDKQVLPQGECDDNYIIPTQRLTYTIRFQNTGTAPAVNVYLLDTLSQDLDMSSLRVVGQSHPGLLTDSLSGNVVRFSFDNIQLPDSMSDPAGSQGYVTFEISPVSGLPDGTQIENRAGIYFDFNDPIITNTVMNTVISTIPLPDLTVIQSGFELLSVQPNATYQWINCGTGQPVPGATFQFYSPHVNGSYAVEITLGGCTGTSECTQIILGVDEVPDLGLVVYPNPAERSCRVSWNQTLSPPNMKIYDLSGKVWREEVLEGMGEQMLSLDLPAGIYQVELQADGMRERTKLVIVR